MKDIKLKKALVPHHGKSNSLSLKNKSGFVLAFFLFLIPLFLAGFFVLSTTIQWHQIHSELESHCLKLQNQSFFRQRNKLKQLLGLNPMAKKLSAEKMAVQLKIAAAVASGQIELVSILKVKLEKILIQQEKLAQKQQQILMQSREEFARQSLQITKTLLQLQQKIRSRTNPLWKLEFSSPHGKHPRLAVTAVSTDIAPVYELEMDFENQQSWLVHWTTQLKPGSSMSALLHFNHEVSQQCRMTLSKDQNFSILVQDKS